MTWFGTIDKPGTSLFQQYTMQSACHTHPILQVSTILDFSTLNIKATVISTFVVHLLWKFNKWLKTCWKNVVCSFVEFLHAVMKLCPTKNLPLFLDHSILHYPLIYVHFLSKTLKKLKTLKWLKPDLSSTANPAVLVVFYRTVKSVYSRC